MDEVGHLVVDLLAFLHQPLDLVDGVDDGGVISATEQASDARVRQVGQLAEHVHRRLPGRHQRALPALAAVSKPEADYVLMVKPQFEVGRERLGAGGVVRDPALRKAAVMEVAESAYDVGLGTLGVTASPLPGPAGNVEYFLWLRRGAPAIDEAALDRAIEIGPQ